MEKINLNVFLAAGYSIPSEVVPYLDNFVKNRENEVQKMDEFVLNNDILSLKRYAHKLRGLCGTYGFSELSEIASDLERACSEITNDDEGVRRHYRRLKNEIINIQVLNEEAKKTQELNVEL